MILAQFNRRHFTNLHAAILDRRLACLEAAAVFELNRYFWAKLLAKTWNKNIISLALALEILSFASFSSEIKVWISSSAVISMFPHFRKTPSRPGTTSGTGDTHIGLGQSSILNVFTVATFLTGEKFVGLTDPESQ